MYVFTNSKTFQTNLRTPQWLTADDRFRWVERQLETLSKCLNLSMLRKALERLPRALDETYERILLSLTPEEETEAFKLLQWIAFGDSTLTSEQLAELITIDTSEEIPTFDSTRRLPMVHDVKLFCTSLVSFIEKVQINYDHAERTVLVPQLAQFSVKEYLTSDRILQGTASKFSIRAPCVYQNIASMSLAYLLQPETETTSLAALKNLYIETVPPYFPHDLLIERIGHVTLTLIGNYCNWWHNNINRAGVLDNACKVLVDRFFKSANYTTWLKIWFLRYVFEHKHEGYVLEHRHEMRKLSEDEFRRLRPPISIMTLLGVYPVVRYLIEQGASLTLDESRAFAPLTEAIAAMKTDEDLEIVDLLIENGASICAANRCTRFSAGTPRLEEDSTEVLRKVTPFQAISSREYGSAVATRMVQFEGTISSEEDMKVAYRYCSLGIMWTVLQRLPGHSASIAQRANFFSLCAFWSESEQQWNKLACLLSSFPGELQSAVLLKAFKCAADSERSRDPGNLLCTSADAIQSKEESP